MSSRFIVGMAAGSLILGGLVVGAAQAQAPSPSLTGSNFEIETDANLVLNGEATDPPTFFDWASVAEGSTTGTERRQTDKDSGTGDDSFGQGTKEDTAVPTVVSGSIPPNKSDLKYFGGYQEGTTSDGFLHLYWTRVQDPSGTTNMDFEFNRNKCEIVDGTATADSVCSSNGVTPVRTAGDLLITYDLANGGTNAVLGKRTWSGTAWGAYTPFSATTAVGTINTSAISEANADGLGSLSPRTFGEASIKLSSVLDGAGAQCVGFGSAYLKSRSSDAFTAAVKDFIAPIPVNITNCGTVNITKTDDATPASPLNGAVFTLYTDTAGVKGVVFDSDTVAAGTQAITCTTSGTDPNAGKCTLGSVPFGTYWVVETTTPAGHATAPDQKVTISSGTPTVNITFIDPRLRGAIKVTKRFHDASATSGFSLQSGVSFTVNGVTTATNANGVACFDNLLFGTYTVTETVPTNFTGEDPKSVTVDNAATCADATYVGETVTFTNTPLSEIRVAFRPLVTGATTGTISCVKDAATALGTPTTRTPDTTITPNYATSKTYTDLVPGTYNCTVVVSATP